MTIIVYRDYIDCSDNKLEVQKTKDKLVVAMNKAESRETALFKAFKSEMVNFEPPYSQELNDLSLS